MKKGNLVVGAGFKSGVVRARVFRAETGKWEDLGIIASSHWFHRLVIWLKRMKMKLRGK